MFMSSEPSGSGAQAHVASGSPTDALYPPSLLMAVTPTEVGVSWLLALHLGMAGAGMYLYGLLALRLRRSGSAVAGLVYMLGEVMISQTGHLNQTNTLAWTPWLM